MQAYGEVMREVTDHTIERWPIGHSFPLQQEMQSITLNVILRTVFGVDEGPALVQLRDRLTELLSVGANPLGMVLSRFPWLRPVLGRIVKQERFAQLLHEVDELLYAQIAQRRAAGRAGRQDVLAMLIEARDETGQPMSDIELRDELITLLVAGHETTATSLAWTFHRILQRPDVLEKLRTELHQVVDSGPVSPQHVNKLEYLDATIKEAQRLTPILPLVGRRLHEPMRLGGCDLPTDVVVAPCIYLTHHRADLWPNPDQFDPDRFLSKKPSPYEFFPFGGGVRYCLGAAFALYEMKIVIAQVLSRVTLRAASPHTVRVVRRGITFAPSAGLPVVLDRLAA
jgi:cytochrome P450